MEKFKNKVAFITGAGSGIGLAIANLLSKEGAKLVLMDNNEIALKQLSNLKNTLLIHADASNVLEIRNAVNKGINNFGHIDFFVANAGITINEDFLNFSEGDFEKIMNLNLKGSYFLAQAAANHLIESKIEGRILFLSSVTGITAHPNLNAYGMSKAALKMLAKSLGVQLGPNKITVNAIAPGATLTERTLKDKNYKETWAQITPTGRATFQEEVASTAAFLLSDEAAQITGQTIVIDGGWTSYSPPPSN